MTPAARIAAAIEVLDAWLAGAPAERTLTTWGRTHRFAGSKDRAAIRDHVWEAIRCRRSFAALGGAETGRGLMIGALRAARQDPSDVFSGAGHAPPPLAEGEGDTPTRGVLPENVRLDIPDWLAADLRASLGADFAPVMAALRHRAPVFLRVNTVRTSLKAAQAALVAEGIETRPHALAPAALEVIVGARRIRGAAAYRDGLVELQDAASQAVVAALGVRPGMRVLDYCAGGGGKTLALAADGAEVAAHDVDPGRMRDLPERAKRAGVRPRILSGEVVAGAGPFDLVFADAPCSGSGAWRRAPEGKWRLTRARLDDLVALQAGILDDTAGLVAPDGRLAYATCSLLEVENGAQVRGFLDRTAGWRLDTERRFTPLDGGDGFYVAVLSQS
ncbi:MAG TPA: SAM-dependent methyltransferase [Rhodobacteraceae bacterium]|nr:SAM-dependent methyltransferase [Paracoccaceae bacterium]